MKSEDSYITFFRAWEKLGRPLYVMPESKLTELVGELRMREAVEVCGFLEMTMAVMTRLQDAQERGVHLERIKRLAKTRRFRAGIEITMPILEAFERRPKGACFTATRVIEILEQGGSNSKRVGARIYREFFPDLKGRRPAGRKQGETRARERRAQ